MEKSLSALFENESVPWRSSYMKLFPKKYTKHDDLLLLPAGIFFEDCWKNVGMPKYVLFFLSGCTNLK